MSRAGESGKVEHLAEEVKKARGELAGMSRPQKVALPLLMLNHESAAQIMKNLEQNQVEEIAAEMARIGHIGQPLQEELLRDFSPVEREGATSVPGGAVRVQKLLDQSVGLFESSEIMAKISPKQTPVASMDQVIAMEPLQLFNLLRHEQIQTIALVASYLPGEKASQLLALMRPDLRAQVVERLATLGPASVEILESVAQSIRAKIGATRARNVNQTGGVKAAAVLLNALPKEMTKAVLMSMNEPNRDLADSISKKMFTFEELESLDLKSLQKILQIVEVQTFAVALKTSSAGLKSKLLPCISKRAADTVTEEINFMGPRKVSEVEAAQAAVIDIVKNLDSTGEISLEEMREAARSN
jgi:flagellar motor switch protein FliG